MNYMLLSLVGLGFLTSTFHFVSVHFQKVTFAKWFRVVHFVYIILAAFSLISMWPSIGGVLAVFMALAFFSNETKLLKDRVLIKYIGDWVLILVGFVFSIYGLGKLSAPDKGQMLVIVSHDISAMIHLPLATGILFYTRKSITNVGYLFMAAFLFTLISWGYHQYLLQVHEGFYVARLSNMTFWYLAVFVGLGTINFTFLKRLIK